MYVHLSVILKININIYINSLFILKVINVGYISYDSIKINNNKKKSVTVNKQYKLIVNVE